jgi:hypothetical protein
MLAIRPIMVFWGLSTLRFGAFARTTSFYTISAI